MKNINKYKNMNDLNKCTNFEFDFDSSDFIQLAKVWYSGTEMKLCLKKEEEKHQRELRRKKLERIMK